jgi:hypothetical protein
MRPAFSRLVGPALVECVGKTNYSMANGIGLVFSVTPAGDASRFSGKLKITLPVALVKKSKP